MLFEYTPYPAGFPVTAPASVPNATMLDAGLFASTRSPNPTCADAEIKTADTLLNVVIPVTPLLSRFNVEFALLPAQFCRPIVVSDTQESTLAVESTDKTVLPSVGGAHARLFSDVKLRFLKSVWPHTVRFWLRIADDRLVEPHTLSVVFTVVSESVVLARVAFSVESATRVLAERVFAVVFESVERPVFEKLVAVTAASVDVPVTPSVPSVASDFPLISCAFTCVSVDTPVTFSVDERIADVSFVCPVTSSVPPVIIDEALRDPVLVVARVDVPVTPRVVGILTALSVAVPDEFMLPDE